MRIDIRLVEILFGGEDHEVGSVLHLNLAEGGRQELFPRGRIIDHEERPRLQTTTGGTQDQRILQCGPELRFDLSGGVELLRRVAPMELSEELFRRN